MFVVRRLVHSTVKRLLGRFVKNDIETLEDGNGLINLGNLNFREDVLNKFINPYGLTVKCATLGNICVSYSQAAIRCEWSNIRVALEPDVASQASQSPQASQTAQDDLGTSLFGFSEEEREEREERGERSECEEDNVDDDWGVFSIFSNLQTKIEGIATSVDHTFSNVEISVDTLVCRVWGKYSESQGITLQTIEIALSGGNVFATLHNCVVPSSCERIEIALSAHSFVPLLQSFRRLTEKTLQTPQTPQTRETIFNVDALDIKIDDYHCRVRELCVSGKSLSFGEIDVVALVTLQNVLVKCMPKAPPVAPPIASEAAVQSCSPFEEDKIFLFRSQPKPTPIASVAKTSSFVAIERNSGSSNVVVKIASVCVQRAPNAQDIAYCTRWTQLFQLECEEKHEKKKHEEKTGTTFDIALQQISLSLPNFPVCVISQASCVVGRTWSLWSAKASSIVVANLIEIRQIRIAGDQVKRVSGDIRNVNILDLPRLVDLGSAFERDPDAVAADFIMRVRHVSGAANPYFDEVLTGETIEIFSAANAIIMTSGRLEALGSSKLRVTSCQISLAPQLVEVSVASMQGILTPAQIRSISAHFVDDDDDEEKQEKQEKQEEREKKEAKHQVLDESRIIRNYAEHPRPAIEQQVPKSVACRMKIVIRQARVILTGAGATSGHLELLLDQFKIRLFLDNVISLSSEKVEILDRLTNDVWNKALILHKFHLRLERVDNIFGDFQIHIGEQGTKGEGKHEDVTISLDQHLVDFVTAYIGDCNVPRHHQEEQVRPLVRSFHVAPFKARIDYKPSSTSQNFMRFMPLRGAVVKVKLFDAFDTTPERLAVEFALHTINHVRNLPRILNGIKPLRAPINIFRNAAELILVPLRGGDNDSDLQDIIHQAQALAGKLAISVLELGPALNVRRVGTSANAPTSLHSNQPTGIKSGIVQAGQTFTADMGTVVAFVSGDMRNLDLFDLPLLVLRPFTAPLADIVNGICNQVDGTRHQRMANKYR